MNPYLIAHARGCDFNKLKKLGFLVMYPLLDDYVFLQDSPEARKLVSQQSQLGVFFLRSKRAYQTVSKAEIDKMVATVATFDVGSKVEVLEGIGAGLEGVVLETGEDGLLCELYGKTRNYKVRVLPTEMVVKND